MLQPRCSRAVGPPLRDTDDNLRSISSTGTSDNMSLQASEALQEIGKVVRRFGLRCVAGLDLDRLDAAERSFNRVHTARLLAGCRLEERSPARETLIILVIEEPARSPWSAVRASPFRAQRRPF